MWILVVLSTVYGSDEVRLTHYDLYEDGNRCSIERAVLEATFTEGEKAVCIEHRSSE
jgi:tRNA A37 threonylcarbamoyladenosine biosynthesis protein TsaE